MKIALFLVTNSVGWGPFRYLKQERERESKGAREIEKGRDTETDRQKDRDLEFGSSHFRAARTCFSG